MLQFPYDLIFGRNVILRHLTQAWIWLSTVSSLRSDGSEANDGEAGGAQDPLGVEKNDCGGDGRQQQHYQLQGLCQDDAGQALSCAETVSKPLNIGFLTYMQI